MTTTFEEITRHALQLPLLQRLALAGVLLETDEKTADSDVDATWEREIQDRIKAVDAGEVEGISFQDVMREAEKQLTQ
jgi:hypothetical protein